jgi:hypothetical protein
LSAGDTVRTGNGEEAVVECLLHTACKAATLCTVQGVRVTTKHPVRVAGCPNWTHPATPASVQRTPVGLYSVLLAKKGERRPSSLLFKGGLVGIAMAHGEVLPEKMRSAFWDSSQCVEALGNVPRDARGRATISGVVRDAEGWVIAYSAGSST